MPDIFVEQKRQSSQLREQSAAAEKSETISQSQQQGGQSEVAQRGNRTVRPHMRHPIPHRPASGVRPFGTASGGHPKHSMFPLSSFAMNPRGVYFATQGETEEIHLFLRRHFITNIPWIIFSVLLVVFPPLTFPLIGSALPFLSLLSPNATLVLLSFYYIAVFGAVILTNFINWYFNVYIVTNQRVLDVDFVNILYREVSATRLNLIQDVTVKTGGAIRAVFDYGDVFIQTAGTEVNFDFHAVPHPQQVAREIEKHMEEARKREGKSDLEEAIER